jgi:hypothetical protein
LARRHTALRVRIPDHGADDDAGQYYDAWLVFRALNLRNFLADTVRTVKTLKPNVTVATYVGSWYPDYPDVGANWAADDFSAGFRFLNPSYQKTGWAGLTDFVVTGCYYTTATIADAVARGEEIGATVEAAGQFSNRAVNDASWTYAGIQLADFKTKTPDDLKRALQAAGATTQGIMVFDFSHDWEIWRPVFVEAFKTQAAVPHLAPNSLRMSDGNTRRRKQRASPIPPRSSTGASREPDFRVGVYTPSSLRPHRHRPADVPTRLVPQGDPAPVRVFLWRHGAASYGARIEVFRHGNVRRRVVRGWE